MSEVGWVLLVVVLVWGGCGWGYAVLVLRRWEGRQAEWQRPAEVAPVAAVVTRPEPAPEPVKPRGKPTVCRLESERGKVSGRVTVAVRRPTLRVPTPSGATVYVASHPDGAEWVYRRVGVERN